MAITINLILKSHFPDRKGVWEDEDFKKIQIIRLNGKNINEIDNLELFNDIKELHLSENNITNIENIDFLSQVSLLSFLIHFT